MNEPEQRKHGLTERQRKDMLGLYLMVDIPVLIVIAVIIFLACRAFGYDANDGAKTIITDGSKTDTQNAITYVDGKNEDGWVMTIGAPDDDDTWASGSVSFNIGQTWTIQGTNFAHRPTIRTASTIVFKGQGSAGKVITVRNIKFLNSGTVDGLVSMEGSTGASDGVNWIIYNCEFNNAGGGTARSMFGENYGLCYSNQFNGTSENRIWLRNTTIGWTSGMSFGTTNTVVIEDNGFKNTQTPGSAVMSQAIDGDRGMRVIFRYNTLTNCNGETHGFTSGAGNEGLQAEVYKNIWYFEGNGSDQADWSIWVWRGGTGAAYSNQCLRGTGTFAGYNSMFKFRAEQSDPYRADHQPGTGLISGSTIGSIPIYHWENTGFDGIKFATAEGTVVNNTDYFTNTVKPSYTQLVYPHPARNESQGGGGGGGSGAVTVGTQLGNSVHRGNMVFRQ